MDRPNGPKHKHKVDVVYVNGLRLYAEPDSAGRIIQHYSEGHDPVEVVVLSPESATVASFGVLHARHAVVRSPECVAFYAASVLGMSGAAVDPQDYTQGEVRELASIVKILLDLNSRTPAASATRSEVS